MNKKTIPVFCFDWHVTQSPAQREILIKPLLPYLQFDVIPWDGVHLELSRTKIRETPLVFFLFPPPPHLLSDPEARLVWIPMWDEAKDYRDTWWSMLPKSLRVVAFSESVLQKAQATGLSALPLKYYNNPEEVKPVSWEGAKVLFYWNRTGLVSREFLEKICGVLDIEILYFRRRVDPGWPSWCDYDLPERLGKTRVKELKLNGIQGHREYLEHLNQSNVFIALRQSEGVGLTFIEAMARGCAVFSYDAPTMNEYIDHKENGYLFASDPVSDFWLRRKKIFQNIYKYAFRMGLIHREILHPLFRYPVNLRQKWADIEGLDLQTLGGKARQSQLDGYKIWKNSLEQFASFILDW